MKKILIIFGLMLLSLTSFSQKQLEKYYTNGFAIIMKGKTEVVLPNKRRVDIVTDTFAIEVEFANKWMESVGQSLHYAKMLNKKPGILLVVHGEADNNYVNELMDIAYEHNITVWLMDTYNDSWRKVNVDVKIKYVY